MQRVVGGFIAKQAKDILLAPPKRPAEEAETEEEVGGPAAAVAESEPVIEEAEFSDDEGNPLGTAYLVPVAVWVIAERRGQRWDELARCLAEPGSRVFLQQERGRVTNVIYAADPERPVGPRAEGLRADEV